MAGSHSDLTGPLGIMIYQNWDNIWLHAWFLENYKWTSTITVPLLLKIWKLAYLISQWNCAPKYANESSTSQNNNNISFKRNIFKTGYITETKSRHALSTLLLVGKVKNFWALKVSWPNHLLNLITNILITLMLIIIYYNIYINICNLYVRHNNILSRI